VVSRIRRGGGRAEEARDVVEKREKLFAYSLYDINIRIFAANYSMRNEI
jgi:hypothetical protein